MLLSSVMLKLVDLTAPAGTKPTVFGPEKAAGKLTSDD